MGQIVDHTTFLRLFILRRTTFVAASLIALFEIHLVSIKEQRKTNVWHLDQDPLEILEHNLIVDYGRFSENLHSLVASFFSLELLPLFQSFCKVTCVFQDECHSYSADALILSSVKKFLNFLEIDVNRLFVVWATEKVVNCFFVAFFYVKLDNIGLNKTHNIFQKCTIFIFLNEIWKRTEFTILEDFCFLWILFQFSNELLILRF